ALFWTVELWAPNREAGITGYDYIHWYRDHPPEDDLKLLAWSDNQCGGLAHVDWYAYEHPQLGPVELGGWDRMNFWRNPPPALREREVARFPAWLQTLAASLPELQLLGTELTPLGEGPAGPDGLASWRLRIAVGNAGYLGSAVSQRAIQRKVVRGLIFELELPEGARYLQGKPRMSGGELSGGPHLAGHAPPSSLQAFLPNREVTGDRAVCTWVVQAPAGARLRWKVKADRAGQLAGELVVGSGSAPA
ncbi:MAG: hypothetical protein RL722_1976, partial [Pseudomonadota bacterium]